MYLAVRDIRFARGRFALMAGVIALVALLVVLLSGLTSGLSVDSTSAITSMPGDHVVLDSPTADGASPTFESSAVSDDQVTRWAGTPGVVRAEPFGIAQVRLVEEDAAGTGVSAFGVRPGSALLPPLTSGRQPGDGQVVLSAGLAAKSRLTVGEAVVLAGRRLVVSGTVADRHYSHTPVVWVTIDVWHTLGGSSGGARAGVTAIDLTTSDADIAAADRAIGTRTLSRADAPSAISSYGAENGSLRTMQGFLLAISTLVVGAFLAIWTVQRRADIAVLKALGASNRYLLRDALGEALVVLCAGVGTGGAAGFGLGLLVRGTVPFSVDVTTTLLPMAVMVALGLVGAVLAVWRITAVDPLIALGAAR
ncbi:ABC transporter permease [Lentzea sp. E54]|uniref:ABC transporter permease n=1 Tax=Lentzea xerophila TaxID=3435883 RepID=UPI003DA6C404